MMILIERLRHFPRFSLSLTSFNFILALWLSLGLNVAFFEKIHALTPYAGFKSWAFVTATVLLLICYFNVLMQILQWGKLAKITALIFVTLGGFTAYFVNSLGVVMSPDQIQNMMQTDTAEVFDLLSWQFFTWTFFFVLVPILCILNFTIRPNTWQKNLKSKIMHILASFALILPILFIYYVDFAAIFRENRELKGMISPQNSISSLMSYYRHKSPPVNLPLQHYGEDAHRVQDAHTQIPKLMVLVVGETARAESFSLNGYAKNTNPELSKQEIINFSQVSSCGTATAVSVPCMFSGMPREKYDEKLASHREGLLDLAQRAGYKVTWMDNNSGCKGTCTRVEQYVFPENLKQKWCADGECHDEILVDALKDYIAHLPEKDTQPRLVVLHQMGSHGPAYFKRTTAQYQPFKPSCDTKAIQGCTPEELINSYDNSIVYTDHVLSQTIDLLKQQTHYQTGFWYLSDHGESTGEHGLYLHGAPYMMAPTQQTHIPMLMWFSEQWKQQQPKQFQCLEKQKNHTLSQDNLFPSLLSLLDIQSQTIDAKLNLLQQCQTT